MSAISASASSILLAPVLTRKPSSFFTQSRSNTASMATTPSSSREIGREVALLEHAGSAGRLERVRRDRVPPAEHEVVERGQRDEVA